MRIPVKCGGKREGLVALRELVYVLEKVFEVNTA
jgi:hypothetical protein